jgi:hypothetical protein
MKILSVGVELFSVPAAGRTVGRTDGRTDGQIDMTKLIVGFRNFANAPKITGGQEWLLESNRKKDSVSNNFSVGDDLWCEG